MRSGSSIFEYFRTDFLYQGSIHSQRAGVVNCGFLYKPEQSSYRNRIRENYVAIYVLNGKGEFIDSDGKSHAVKAGDVIQMPAGKAVSLIRSPTEDWAECFIGINKVFHSALCEIGSIDGASGVLHPGLEESLVLRFDQILQELKKPSEAIAARALIHAHELLVEIQRLSRQSQPRNSRAELMETARFIVGGNLQRKLDLKLAAKTLHLSYERFRKLFLQEVGVAPHQYRIEQRMAVARTLLLEEDLNNNEIAAILGYADSFAFAKQFKKSFGTSPGLFRRKKRM